MAGVILSGRYHQDKMRTDTKTDTPTLRCSGEQGQTDKKDHKLSNGGRMITKRSAPAQRIRRSDTGRISNSSSRKVPGASDLVNGDRSFEIV